MDKIEAIVFEGVGHPAGWMGINEESLECICDIVKEYFENGEGIDKE